MKIYYCVLMKIMHKTLPAKFLPSTVPTNVRGKMTNMHMDATAIIVVKGIALEAW